MNHFRSGVLELFTVDISYFLEFFLVLFLIFCVDFTSKILKTDPSKNEQHTETSVLDRHKYLLVGLFDRQSVS